MDETTLISIEGDSNQVNVVNESGLYALVLGSRKKEAKDFKRWITHDVLPSIRKTGAYGVEKALNDPVQLRALLGSYAERTAALEARVQEMIPAEKFCHAVTNSVNAMTIQDYAKILGWGPNRLFAWLRGQRYLMDGNRPYQEFIDRGYFRVKEGIWHNSAGEPQTFTRTLITGKGQQYIQSKLQQPQSA